MAAVGLADVAVAARSPPRGRAVLGMEHRPRDGGDGREHEHQHQADQGLGRAAPRRATASASPGRPPLWRPLAAPSGGLRARRLLAAVSRGAGRLGSPAHPRRVVIRRRGGQRARSDAGQRIGELDRCRDHRPVAAVPLEQRLADDRVDAGGDARGHLAGTARGAVHRRRGWQRRRLGARPVTRHRRVHKPGELAGVGERPVLGGAFLGTDPGDGRVHAEARDLHAAARGPAQRSGNKPQVREAGGVRGGYRLRGLGNQGGRPRGVQRPVAEHVGE